MSTFRVNKNVNYTVMSNHHLQDKRLSLKAKGLLSYMLSLPDDWDYSLKGLTTGCRDGIDSVRSAVHELEDGGYLCRSKVRDARGRIIDYNYEVFELPQKERIEKRLAPVPNSPSSENPMSGFPTLENPTQQNTKAKSALGSADVLSVLLQVRSKMRNYNYTLNSAEDLTEDEQIEWFEVLNNAGSRVSIIQMRFSKLKAHGIDIYKQYTNLYRTRVYEAGYEDFFTPQKTNVSYPVAALNPAYEVITQKPHSGNYAPIPSDTKENQLCNLSPEQLTQCFSMTLAALDRTLDFINENTPTQLPRIDYINYLLGYFIFHNEVLTEDNKEKLLQWMDNVDFTNKSNSERRDIFTALIT